MADDASKIGEKEPLLFVFYSKNFPDHGAMVLQHSAPNLAPGNARSVASDSSLMALEF